MNVENNFTAHNAYFRFLRARLDEANVLDGISDNLGEISGNVARLKPTGSTEVRGQVATHAGDGWDALIKPLAGQLERIATALEKRSDNTPAPAPSWPDQASGGALYALRLLSHVRLRLFDTRQDDLTVASAELRAEISQHLQQMRKETLLAPQFTEVDKLLADQAPLKTAFEALFAPLADKLALRDAISLRLRELVEVEYRLVNALASQAWPASTDPFDDSATRAVRANTKK